jgi:hypothetical protein
VAYGELPIGTAMWFFGRVRALPDHSLGSWDESHITVILPGLQTLPHGMEWRHAQPDKFRRFEYSFDEVPSDPLSPDCFELGVWAFKLLRRVPTEPELASLVSRMAEVAGFGSVCGGDHHFEVSRLDDGATSVFVTPWKPM